MKQLMKALSCVFLVCISATMLLACTNHLAEDWLSPVMHVDLEMDELEVYDNFTLNELNVSGITPSAFVSSSAVTKATLSLAYQGSDEYKARIGVRIDRIETEEDGSIGHNVAEFGVPKSNVTVLFYANETWYDGGYGSNAASGGDTLFDERYYTQSDAAYSATRRALLFNQETVQGLASIDFYVVGLSDGYYVLNFYVEAADLHGHFHGINKLALTTAVLTVGTPVFESDGGENE